MKKIILSLLLIGGISTDLRSGVINNYNDEYSYKINHSRLYAKLIEHGVRYPDIAFAQALLESGYFKSPLFNRANNLFGMQMPTKRPTTATGITNGYSKYETWSHSVLDYKLLQEALFKRKGEMSRHEYLKYIDRWYSRDGKYIIKIKSIIKKHSYIFANHKQHI
jgi:uncharacterized FlgJ-related protein